MPNEFIIKNGFISQGNSSVNGSLSATTLYGDGSQLSGIVTDNFYTTAFTYSSNTFTIFDNSGNTFPVTVNDFTGLTINGDLNVTGTSTFNDVNTNTISASTYYGATISSTTVNTTVISATTIYVEGDPLDSGPSNLFNYYNFI